MGNLLFCVLCFTVNILILLKQCLTSVLDYISGVKLSDASKKLGKKFATGASVVKVIIVQELIFKCFQLCSLCFVMVFSQGPTEKDQIDVQGDIFYDIVEFITATWPDVSYYSYCPFI